MKGTNQGGTDFPVACTDQSLDPDQCPNTSFPAAFPTGYDPMRSNSRNFMLSASVSRSDDEQNGTGPPQPQLRPTEGHFMFPPPNSMGMPQGIPGVMSNRMMPPRIPQAQPSLESLYCQMKEMETRLRHLELVVFSNPALLQAVANPAAIINPVAANEEVAYGVGNVRNTVDAQDKMIHRGDLDRVCLPVLERYSHPPSTALNDIARQLEPQFPNMFRQELLSVIRRWFRKRREEMSQRIFNALRKALGGREMSRDELVNFADNLQENDPILARVKRDANLEIADDEEATKFCHQKMVSYLKRTADELQSLGAGGDLDM